MTRGGRAGGRKDLERRLHTTESWVEAGLLEWGPSRWYEVVFEGVEESREGEGRSREGGRRRWR